MSRKSSSVFLLVAFCALITQCGSGSTLCTRENTEQGLFFDASAEGSSGLGNRVDFRGEPTHHAGAPWVEKILVNSSKEFLLITHQKKGLCANKEEMEKNIYAKCENYKIIKSYYIRRYTYAGGYEEWNDEIIPKHEWEKADTINFQFSAPPLYHYKNCRANPL